MTAAAPPEILTAIADILDDVLTSGPVVQTTDHRLRAMEKMLAIALTPIPENPTTTTPDD